MKQQALMLEHLSSQKTDNHRAPAISRKEVHTWETGWTSEQSRLRSSGEKKKLLKEMIPSDLIAKHKVNPGTDVPKHATFHSSPFKLWFCEIILDISNYSPRLTCWRVEMAYTHSVSPFQHLLAMVQLPIVSQGLKMLSGNFQKYCFTFWIVLRSVIKYIANSTHSRMWIKSVSDIPMLHTLPGH